MSTCMDVRLRKRDGNMEYKTPRAGLDGIMRRTAMKIMFCDKHNVQNTYGKLTFGANGLNYMGAASGIPPMWVRCAVPQDDGSYSVYGFTGSRHTDWRIVRCRTFDGLHYDQTETVHYEAKGSWLISGDIAHNSRDGSVLCLKWRSGKAGHSLWAFGSEDGSSWRMLLDKPVYIDHDAFGLMWDRGTERYITYQITYQSWSKHYPDNIGDSKRRVLYIRTSEDGIHWEPSEEVLFAGPYVSDERLITPDERDPAEMEFYRMTVFPYAEYYVGMMLNYAPSPQVVNPAYPQSKHGPHLSGEWWLGREAHKLGRPFRNVFAPGQAPGIVLHNPINLDGKHLWIVKGDVYGLPQDRLFFVGSMANAEFSTPLFDMPSKPLVLNAADCFHDQRDRGMRGQSYVMAEILGEDGQVIEGFNKENCLLRGVDGSVRLHWRWNDGTSLAGQRIRLRLYLRDARIYSLSTLS